VFSTTFRYALISLLELADSGRCLQASLIARKFRLSPHYLSVVLRELRKQGLVDSQKGNKGGYRLLCRADSINLLDLYRSLAGAGGDCGPSLEAQTPAAGADAWLSSVGERWSGELAATTLADLQQWTTRQLNHPDADQSKAR
jgi:Rrf2 family protein